MSSVKFHPKQLQRLQTVFPAHEILPESTTQEVYFRAGIAHVLQYISKNTEHAHQQHINPVPIGEIPDG